MNAAELIVAKREGRELEAAEIEWLVDGYVEGRLPDYQMSAFLMAVVFRGMTPRETAAYTRAMIRSGDTLRFPGVAGVKVDKHSTGGVGDKVSIPLAPLVAACGARVPMMSGRGLGHTGGTLDKLEAIAGFRVALDAREAARLLEKYGMFMIGQTDRVAPADKKLYALRDVTGTIESIPLICGSILSKKVAAGVEALVMDVKTGSGAFMRERDAAKNLARALVDIGSELGLQMRAYITSMEQPLGRRVGNSLELIECIEFLRGEGPADLREITLVLAGEMLALAGVAPGAPEGRRRAAEVLESGAAFERFVRVAEAQGGDIRMIEDPGRLPLAPGQEILRASEDGYITEMETREIGLACNGLGAGRAKTTDTVDPGVGLMFHAKIGDAIRRGEPMMTIYHRDGRGLEEARRRLAGAVRIGPEPPAPHSLILEYLN